MKQKLIVLTALLATMAGTAVAQQSAGYMGPYHPQEERHPAPASYNTALQLDTASYIFFTRIIRNDTAQHDLLIPESLGAVKPGDTVQLRGAGVIFSPSTLYASLNGSVYNETSNIYFDPSDPNNTNGISDQAYINQFKGAQSFTIDSLLIYVYPGQQSELASVNKVMVYNTTINMGTTTVKKSGFKIDRSKLTVANETDIQPEDLGTKLNGTSVTPTKITYPDGLLFNNGESAIIMYQNDDAPTPTSQTSDYSLLLGFDQYRTGHNYSSTNGPSTLGMALDSSKSIGLVDYHYTGSGNDSIYTSWNNLFFSVDPTAQSPVYQRAIWSPLMTIWGAVELSSGIRYQYGTDATSQGLSAVTPNPVHDHARVAFALTERAHVEVDLYGVNGEHIRSLASQSLIPGKYSADLHAEGLQNGVYMIRMVANDKVYTQKVTVSK